MPQFHDPIAPKEKKIKGKSPWDFRCPPYDERSSCYMHAGTNYGVGHKNPVGHDGKVKQRVPTMPFDHKMGMETDVVSPKTEDPMYIE